MNRRFLIKSVGFTAEGRALPAFAKEDGKSLAETALPLIEMHLTVSKDEAGTLA